MATVSFGKTSFQIVGHAFAQGGNGGIYPAIEILPTGFVKVCVAKKNQGLIHVIERENYLLFRKEKAPHIVELLGYDDKEFILYLERVPDDLYLTYLHHKKPLPLKDYTEIAGSMLETMSHLERLNLVFPDFKPNNMAWDPVQREWKMFDLPTISDPSKKTAYKLSPWSYKPLELLFELPYTHKVNMWLVGVVLYEIAAQEIFSHAENPEEALEDMEDRCPEKVPDHMIDASPIKDDFYHPKVPDKPYQKRKISDGGLAFWTNKMRNYQPDFIKLMSKMLALDPQQRIAASEALLIFQT